MQPSIGEGLTIYRSGSDLQHLHRLEQQRISELRVAVEKKVPDPKRARRFRSSLPSSRSISGSWLASSRRDDINAQELRSLRSSRAQMESAQVAVGS